MTPSELDELEAKLKATTPGVWIDMGDTEPYPGCIVASDDERDRLTVVLRDAEMDDRPEDRACTVALHNAAPALIAAAREVDRLRAFVPRWERQQSCCYRLLCGKTVLAAIEIYDDDSAAWWMGDWFTGRTMRDANIESAARAVCARLGIPYVPVDVDDG